MKILNELFPNSNIKDYSKKGNALLATIDDVKVSVKKKTKDINKIYTYLESRNFDYFPKLLNDSDKYNVYECISDVDCDITEKAFDFMNILSLLHSKTTYYKEMDIDEYKKIYEDTLDKINNTKIYYEKLIDDIETHIFMSPSDYLIARNISKILASFSYAETTLNTWYDTIKLNAKKRVVLLYNNVDINHLIKSKDIYLLNWDKSEVGLPIYDLYEFYKKYNMYFDFTSLFKTYENRYPLNEEEKLLFYVIISIPDVINYEENEMNNVKNVKKIIDYIYRSEVFINEINNINP